MPRPVITERRCCCAKALPIAPGDVPVMKPGLPVHEFLPHGRAPQSMAFLRAAGMERSCSGVTIKTPSARASSFLKRTTSGGRLPCQRLSQFAVNGVAAIAVDDHGDA